MCDHLILLFGFCASPPCSQFDPEELSLDIPADSVKYYTYISKLTTQAHKIADIWRTADCRGPSVPLFITPIRAEAGGRAHSNTSRATSTLSVSEQSNAGSKQSLFTKLAW